MDQKKFSEMSDAEMSTFVHRQLEVVENGNKQDAMECQTLFIYLGGIRGIHVRRAGEPKKDFSTRETLEWYVGQFIEITASSSWFAMNGFINTMDKFAPVVN